MSCLSSGEFVSDSVAVWIYRSQGASALLCSGCKHLLVQEAYSLSEKGAKSGLRSALQARQRFWGIASSARGERLLRLRSRKRSWSGTLSNLSTHMSQECRRFCKETYPIYPRIETQRGDNLTCHCLSTRSGEFFKESCVTWSDH